MSENRLPTVIYLITFTLIVSLAGCVLILGDSNKVDKDVGMVVTDIELFEDADIEDKDDDRQSESTDN